MLPITAGELNEARSEFTGLMNTTATRLKRASATPDGRGGQRNVPVPVGTFQCALCPSSRGNTMAREEVEAERNTEIIDWIVVCPVGTQLDRKDLIQIGNDRYEIEGTNVDRTDQLVLAFNARRIK